MQLGIDNLYSCNTYEIDDCELCKNGLKRLVDVYVGEIRAVAATGSPMTLAWQQSAVAAATRQLAFPRAWKRVRTRTYARYVRMFHVRKGYFQTDKQEFT